MADYRLYRLDDKGKIKKAEWIEARSDDEAIVMARAMKLPFECELWNGTQLVSHIMPHVPSGKG